jgi:hypothetical protein
MPQLSKEIIQAASFMIIAKKANEARQPAIRFRQYPIGFHRAAIGLNMKM